MEGGLTRNAYFPSAVRETFECEDCDKIFDFEDLLGRHTEAVHSDPDSVIFCYYYNNDKEWPFVVCLNMMKLKDTDMASERRKCMYSHNYERSED